MKARISVLFSIVTAGYVAIFLAQDSANQHTNLRLSPPLPTPFYEISGPFKQLVADILLIKTKVFLGGRSAETDPLSYAENLDRQFSAISDLHPELLDIYYLCESSLSWISRPSAERSNQILSAGLEGRPEQWTIPFFIGFNNFRYLQDNDVAIRFLSMAANKPFAPEWVGSLANLLSTDGGDIVAGFLLLREMRNQTVDPLLRSNLDRDISQYQNALVVLRAIASYNNINGHRPGQLTDLIPKFLAMLPRMEDGYELEYFNQRLHLHKATGQP
ncbi:MAG TPA: hypothetical protein VNI58_01355 [Mariprofundaceae bacterium]|nr:hypothetical protein [Mariprofundaceae bacterium]